MTTATVTHQRTDHRGEARRKAMLEAACELFLERGFGGTSMGDVVARSGGSLATLYATFGSKEKLFEAIVEEVSAQLLAPLDAPEFESKPLDEALCRLGEAFLSHLLDPQTLRWQRMCAAEGPKFPELRTALLHSGPERVRGRLAAYLAAQAEAGRLALDDPHAAAVHFLALVKSEVAFAAVCGEPIDLAPEAVPGKVQSAVDVFLYGYAARRARPGRTSRR